MTEPYDTSDIPSSAAADDYAEVSKDVVIIAYGTSSPDTDREFLADLLRSDPDCDADDAHAKSERTKTDRYLEVGHERTDVSLSMWNVLQDADDTGDITLATDERTTLSHDYSTGKLLDRFLDAIARRRLPNRLDVGAGYDQMHSPLVFEDEDGKQVDASPGFSDSVERRRVLTHQSRRDADNRYETPPETPKADLPFSFSLSITIEAGTPRHLDALSKAVVKPLHDEVAQNDAIEKVRLTDCTTVVEKQGDCYDL